MQERAPQSGPPPERAPAPPPAGRPSAGGEFQAGVAYASTFGSGPMTPAAAGAGAGAAVIPPGGAAFPAPVGRAQSPYLRLARNANFSLLWVGQLVSLFGDRVHQVALAFLVAQYGPLHAPARGETEGVGGVAFDDSLAGVCEIG